MIYINSFLANLAFYIVLIACCLFAPILFFLPKKHMLGILDNMLDEISTNLIDKGINLEVSKTAKEWICEQGFDPLYGARPLRRVIQDNLEDQISDYLLSGKLKIGDTAYIKMQKDKLVLVSKPPKSSKKSETLHLDTP